MTECRAVTPVNAVVSPFLVAAGVPLWWDPLFRACGNRSIFTSGAWIQSWMEVYGDDFDGQWVHWEHDGVVVAGCLLVTRMAGKWLLPMRSLFLNATGETTRRTPFAEYNDILCLSGFEDSIAVDAARVVSAMRWSRFHMLGYQEDALVSRMISHLPIAALDNDFKKASFIDLVALGEVEFGASLSGKAGNHIRRNRRLFEETYGSLTVVHAQDFQEAMRYFVELAALHNARWRTKGQGGSFSSAAVVDFHERLIARLWPQGLVDLVCVRTGVKVVGYLYNFTSENKVYFFQSGFTYEDGSKRSPGLLTHALCIESYRLKGYSEYDLLAGEAQYKRELTKQERTLCWTILYRNAAWTRFLLWARGIKFKLAPIGVVSRVSNPD